ncbi:MAG: signal peptidase II [Mediterraneibacter gnavus]
MLIFLRSSSFTENSAEKKICSVKRVCAILLASGAIGNLIDRLARNYGSGFRYFNLIDFPIFNVADCYVVIMVASFLES